MKPSILDDIEANKEKAATIVANKEGRLKRNEDYPKYGKSIGKCTMQLPPPNDDIWFIQANTDFPYSDYYSKWEQIPIPSNIDDCIIRSAWEITDFRRKPVRSYNWLKNIFCHGTYGGLLFPLKEIINETEEETDFFNRTHLNNILSDGDIMTNDLWFVSCDIDHVILTKHDITVWLSFLSSQIQVHLVSPEKMPKPQSLKRYYNKTNDTLDKSKVMETLGVYVTEEANSDNTITGKIMICPQRIREVSVERKIGYDNLFIIVYLHELAHAAMDERISAKENDYTILWQKKELLETNNDQVFAMEESLANMIMLKYLECFDKQRLDDAKKFVLNQMKEYAFGYYQFRENVDWTKWRDYKSKHTTPDEKLNEWFINHFSKEYYTKEMFDKVFE